MLPQHVSLSLRLYGAREQIQKKLELAKMLAGHVLDVRAHICENGFKQVLLGRKPPCRSVGAGRCCTMRCSEQKPRRIRTIRAVVFRVYLSVPCCLCQVLHDREFLLIAARRLRLAAFGLGSESAALASPRSVCQLETCRSGAILQMAAPELQQDAERMATA